jgi:hypothetical protein
VVVGEALDDRRPHQEELVRRAVAEDDRPGDGVDALLHGDLPLWLMITILILHSSGDPLTSR